MTAAFTIISEANSMPGETTPSVKNVTRSRHRIPQLQSEMCVPKRRLRIHVSTGVPRYRCSGGIAPSSILPRSRDPMTNVEPPRARSMNRGTSPKSYDWSASPMMT